MTRTKALKTLERRRNFLQGQVATRRGRGERASYEQEELEGIEYAIRHLREKAALQTDERIRALFKTFEVTVVTKGDPSLDIGQLEADATYLEDFASSGWGLEHSQAKILANYLDKVAYLKKNKSS